VQQLINVNNYCSHQLPTVAYSSNCLTSWFLYSGKTTSRANIECLSTVYYTVQKYHFTLTFNMVYRNVIVAYLTVWHQKKCT